MIQFSVNVQKEYVKEAFTTIQKFVGLYRPPLGLRGAKIAATPTESDPVKMLHIMDQNTKHYQTAALVSRYHFC